jgi:uncharacterized membrane protein
MNPEILKNNSKIEKVLYQIFEFGILIKFFNSVWEITSGLLILYFGKEAITKVFYFLAGSELLENPHDFIINISFGFLQNLSHGTQIFIVIYLLVHGFMNLFLAVQLYRDKIWAYLATIIIMVVFMFYQIHRIILYHSAILTIITIFDILFIILTWHEYNHKKYLKVL